MKKLLQTVFFGAFIFAVVPVLVAQVDLENGLVGYYKMDESGGDITVNSAQGDNVAPDGTLMNSPLWGEGRYDAGLWFTSSSTNYVSLGVYDPSEGTDQLSISVWVNWQGIDSRWHGICGKRDAWAVDDILWSNVLDMNSGGIQFETYTAGGKVYIITTSAPAIGDWTHVVSSFDGAWAIFYMNGEMVAEGAMQLGLDREASFHFGCGTANGVDTFSGGIDELRFYNRPLTDEEALALYIYDPTSVDNGKSNIVNNFSLQQNYPNPFNPATVIGYELEKDAHVTLKVFNIMGEKVRTLVNANQAAGAHRAIFEAGDLPGGVYFYKIAVANKFEESRKMLLLR